jgi:hypothetical protein
MWSVLFFENTIAQYLTLPGQISRLTRCENIEPQTRWVFGELKPALEEFAAKRKRLSVEQKEFHVKAR